MDRDASFLWGAGGPEAGRGGGLVFGRGETEDRDRISHLRETQDVSNLMHKPAPSSSRAQSKRAWGEPEPLPAETSWVLRPHQPHAHQASGLQRSRPRLQRTGASLAGLGFALAAQVGAALRLFFRASPAASSPAAEPRFPTCRRSSPPGGGGAAGATNPQPFLRLAPHRSQQRRRLHPGQPAIAHRGAVTQAAQRATQPLPAPGP